MTELSKKETRFYNTGCNWVRTKKIFGRDFVYSCLPFNTVLEQGFHFFLHAVISTVHILVFGNMHILVPAVIISAIGAIFIETKDGFKEDAIEGFNIYPDFLFRILGATLPLGLLLI